MKSIESLLDEYRTTSEKYAEAKGYRIYIEEFRKSKLAMSMKDAEVSGVKTSASQERDALATEGYRELLEALRDVVIKEERLRYKLRCLEAEIEVWRTQRADERVERKAYSA